MLYLFLALLCYIGAGVWKYIQKEPFHPTLYFTIACVLASAGLAGIEALVGWSPFLIGFVAISFSTAVMWYVSSCIAWLIGKGYEAWWRYFSRCPYCDHSETIAERKCEIFDAVAHNGVQARLTAMVDEFECCECGGKWTGGHAEGARDRAVAQLNKRV
jgi:hypothetical protein